MAKKVIRPLHNEAEYEAAVDEIEGYFEHEPRRGTPEADRFDLLALVIEDYEKKRWPIDPPTRSTRSVSAWRSAAARRRTSVVSLARGSALPISSRESALSPCRWLGSSIASGAFRPTF